MFSGSLTLQIKRISTSVIVVIRGTLPRRVVTPRISTCTYHWTMRRQTSRRLNPRKSDVVTMKTFVNVRKLW